MSSVASDFSEKMSGKNLKAVPEEILEITVHCAEGHCVQGKHMRVTMIPFTGEASGPYFHGNVIGTGTDTQKTCTDNTFLLSARYMLEGRDHTGRDCRIFIENNGTSPDRCIPTVVTDSDALAHWEDTKLSSRVENWGDSVKVHIYAT